MRAWVSWKRLFLLGATALVGYLAYRTCPCTVAELRGDEKALRELRVISQPKTCAAALLPGEWIWPDEKSGETSHIEVYELRSSKPGGDELFVALKNRAELHPLDPANPIRYSKNKFGFRFHPSDQNGHARIDGLRSASEDEWAKADLFPSYAETDPQLTLDPRMRESGGENYVIYKGHKFPTSKRYSLFGSLRMVSGKDVYIAVPSHGGPALREGTSFGFKLIPDLWWREHAIDIYRVSTQTRVAEVKGWACFDGLFQSQLISWHGDAFMSMPLTRDARQIILCDFRGK